MNVWFGGGEVAAHRSLLAREGVEHIAVNLSAYFKQRQALRMSEAYDGFKVVLYSSEGGLDPRKVESFISNNIDKFELVYGLPCDAPVFVPEWGGGDLHSFYSLASQHPVVGLTEAVALDQTLMTPILAFARREHIKLMTASSKQDALAAARWSDVIMTAWLTTSKHRELQVWDGRIVKRYARIRKAAALDRHGAQIERLGIDVEALQEDDVEAALTLAVRSWRMWSAADNVVPLRVVANSSGGEGDGTGTGGELAIANSVEMLRTPTIERAREELSMMQMLGVADDSANTVVQISPKQLRSCNSCFLAQHCPKFQPDHECAFEIPVRITTKGELQAVINALLEMQVQRIFMARFAEDLLSQGLDPIVSIEIERFMRMIKTIREIEENRETVVITAKAQAGRLSALFGSHVGEAATQLQAPVESRALMSTVFDGEIVDAEAVEEPVQS